MSNTLKAIAFGVVFLLVGLCAKFGLAAFSSNERDDAVATANIVKAITPTENPAVGDITEIPGKHEPKVPDNLSAQASIVIDLSSGEEIFSLHKTERWPLASLSKLMSAVVALENMELEQKVTLSSAAIATEGVAGGFTTGETYMIEDLVYAMMVVSSNDAAVALSENMPAGRFVELMNLKTSELGMNDTRFVEPTGLSMLNQGTVNDLALLVEYAWSAHPDLFSVSSRKITIIRELNARKNIRLTNINTLAERSDFLGGKTGYTEDANENLISVFSINGKPTTIIILGADNRIEEANKILSFIKNDINANN
ncbi:MAG: serine hydrolase [Parcubacteria group bacterium]|jgi:D-alanyl-D-alanine carboxypeptidase